MIFALVAFLFSTPTPVVIHHREAAESLRAMAARATGVRKMEIVHFGPQWFHVLNIDGPHFIFFKDEITKGTSAKPLTCFEGVRLEVGEGDDIRLGDKMAGLAFCTTSDGNIEGAYYPSENQIMVAWDNSGGAPEVFGGVRSTLAAFDATSGKKIASADLAGSSRGVLLHSGHFLVDVSDGRFGKVFLAADPENEAWKALAPVASREVSLSAYPLLVLAGKKNAVFNAATGDLFPFDPLPGQGAPLAPENVATPSGLALARADTEGSSVFLLDLKANAQPRRVVSGLNEISDLFFNQTKRQLVVRTAPSSPWKDILSLRLAASAPIENANYRKRHAPPGEDLTKLPTELKEILVSWPGEQVTEVCYEFAPGRAPKARQASSEDLLGAAPCSDKWQKARTRSLAWRQVAKSAATSPLGSASYFFNALLRERGDEMLDVLDPSPWLSRLDQGELIMKMAGPALDVAAAENPAAKSALWETTVRQLLLEKIAPATLALRYQLINAVINSHEPLTPTLRDQHPDDFWADWQIPGITLQAHFRRGAATSALGWVVVDSRWRDASDNIHPVFEPQF